MKKLQPYKNGAIYKHKNKYLYITESGKTRREYRSIKELNRSESPITKTVNAEKLEETTEEVDGES